MECKFAFHQQNGGTIQSCEKMYVIVCVFVWWKPFFILTVVDICISNPPDRALLSITAGPTVQLAAYKQPGNDGVLQLVQQHWLISFHIPLPQPLMPICVSHTLAIAHVSSCSFLHEQPDQCPNL